MNKKKQLENCKIALGYWKTIPRRNVVKGLHSWFVGGAPKKHTCATVACFGGWVAGMPEFKEMGVCLDTDGFPYLENDPSNSYGLDLAVSLFGESLFEHAGACVLDQEAEEILNAHDLVTFRLQKQIEILEGALA